jgi:Zinc finger, C3HC4 type (RING finger)
VTCLPTALAISHFRSAAHGRACCLRSAKMPLSASLEPIEKMTRLSPSSQSSDPHRAALNIGFAPGSGTTSSLVPAAGVTLNQQTTGVPLLHDVRVEWSAGRQEPRLLLMNPPPAARVTVNGKLTASGCRLRDGDLLSFRSSLGTHQYSVRITGADDAPRKLPAAQSSAGEPTRRARGDAKNRKFLRTPPPPDTPEESPAANANFSAAAEEFTCVVCLEIMYLSTTLVPCGHSLCKECVPAGSGACCPVCRTQFQHQVPNKIVDNAISALSHCPDFFDGEDLSAYRSRSGTTTMISTGPSGGGKRVASSAPPNHSVVRVTIATSRGKRRRLAMQQELQGLGTTPDDAIQIE